MTYRIQHCVPGGLFFYFNFNSNYTLVCILQITYLYILCMYITCQGIYHTYFIIKGYTTLLFRSSMKSKQRNNEFVCAVNYRVRQKIYYNYVF